MEGTRVSTLAPKRASFLLVVLCNFVNMAVGVAMLFRIKEYTRPQNWGGDVMIVQETHTTNFGISHTQSGVFVEDATATSLVRVER